MTNANTVSKTCFKCGSCLPRTEFYKHSQMADGLLGKCKTCAKQDATKHRNSNLDKVRAYDRDRAKNAERRKAAAEINKRWRSEDKRRTTAHNAVRLAVRKGELVRVPCCVCGDHKSLAHHESYDRPLDLVWYCQIHHKARHKEMVLQDIDP